MAQWIILVSPTMGVSVEAHNTAVLEEVTGTEVDATDALLAQTRTYSGSIRKVVRREVFKCSDRSYFVRLHGRMLTYGYLVQLAELISDSDSPDLSNAAHSD